MNKTYFLLLVAINLLFVTKSFSQGRYNDYNRLGITAGIHQFDITTNDLITTKGTGFHGGLSTRGTIGRHFDMVYFLHLNRHEMNVLAKENALTATVSEEVQMKLLAAKLGILGSYKLGGNHFSIEFGPALQLSDKFEFESTFAEYILEGYDTFTVNDARKTSNLNVNGIIGFSAGFETFKISIQYEYGFTNVLSKLTVDNKTLKGNTTQLSGSATFYL
ncbi:outer membrane beta-barrel protein [uncultured Kordia sp.]|uniref:outer membrane beta-barrel protein n=1 Tax=uncultured Kordia sp. TaxID=507699 RepID=UPI00260725A2|nr:outer membrane beta-barrel protein [uncultured Kordia sp.]